jgi:hypothetical protein
MGSTTATTSSAGLTDICKGITCTLVRSAGFAVSPVSAAVIAPVNLLQQQLQQDSSVIEVVVRRGTAVRRTTVVGPRGNAASRTVVRRGAVMRPGVVRPGGWVCPANYEWRSGGAIAAGAGIVAAATVVARAGSPPAPGYCW